MRPLTFLLRGAIAICVSSALACSSTPEDASTVPAQVDSGFVFLDNAFPFENFGGSTRAPRLTASMMARMFGPELVCKADIEGCELKPVAEAWMRGTNATLEQGRSEGMAVLSLLFFSGELDPDDFGASNAGNLHVDGNYALQQELAYWAATQAVPSAMETNARYSAAEVMPFLAEALQPDSPKNYRLAIAQKTASGFQRGHALTPIGYYKGEGELYWLRVYDNNFPQKERRLEINPAQNYWRYEIPSPDGPIVYEGTPDNGNLLYFSAVQDRLGTLKAPFAGDTDTITVTYSGVTVVSANSAGEETGIKDGKIIEAPGDRVIPAFSNCPVCGNAVAIVNQAMRDEGVTSRVYEVTSSDDVTVEQNVSEDTEAGGRFISGSGPNYTTQVYMNGDNFNDKASFDGDGNVEYTSDTNDGLKVVSTKENDDGSSSSVSVSLDGAEGSAKVKVTHDEEGNTVVDVEGLPEGTEVEVTLTSTDADGNTKTNTATYKSNGNTSTATLNPDTGQIDTTETDEIDIANCSNGVLDAGLETDVDCGGQCPGCRDALSCEADADCAGGACVDSEGEAGAKVCVSPACHDAQKNGAETDVDCGGDLCLPCVATTSYDSPACLVDADCDTQMCREGRCRKKSMVYLIMDRVPDTQPGGVEVQYLLDGQLGTYQLPAGTLDTRYELGEAWRYQLVSAEVCWGDPYGVSLTGISDDEDTLEEGRIVLDCPADGARTLRVDLVAGADAPEVTIAEADPIRLGIRIDGGVEQTFDYSGKLPLRIGDFTTSWSARIIRSPLGTTYPDPLTGAGEGGYSCTLGSASAPRETIKITCAWADEITCSDGVRNQDESDVDCGGETCEPCATGRACEVASDCDLLACESRICISVGNCTDGVKNQDEGDIDCGGVCATKCTIGDACNQDADCESGAACAGGACTSQQCSDGVQNGTETDVDCGGSTCAARCNSGQDCNRTSDCISGALCGANGCTISTCGNGVKDGDETDVDCGGATCTACANRKFCANDSDCSSDNCECGASSGSCDPTVGKCAAGKWIVKTPTTDGVAASQTVTVPADCIEMRIEAWGAGGGTSDDGTGFGFEGGAAGYVSGTLPTTPGDIFTVWIGAGGVDSSGVYMGQGYGVGSNLGTPANGGWGDASSFGFEIAGSGGGLTSIRQTGANMTSFVVPAGAGASVFQAGADVASGSGGGALDANGEDGLSGSGEGGGGAGDPGGSSNAAGAYGPLPTGLSSADGFGGIPAGTSSNDYSSCSEIGDVAAGSGDAASISGGDGCVILRCVAR